MLFHWRPSHHQQHGSQHCCCWRVNDMRLISSIPRVHCGLIVSQTMNSFTHPFCFKMPLCAPFPGCLSVLVMYNARIHHREGILELAAQFCLCLNLLVCCSPVLEVQVEFLPPYPPDLNLIEEEFSKVKAFIQWHNIVIAKAGDGMIFDMMQIREVNTTSDTVGYFIHAG